MTDLEQQQHALLALIKKRTWESRGDDEYLRQVADSAELGLVREIALWWRALGIQRNCTKTSLLLKRLGRFEQAVEAFYCQGPTSPYMEAMSLQFLQKLAADADPLVAEMARLELATARAAAGDDSEFTLEWDRDPAAVLQSLQTGGPLPVPGRPCTITVRAATVKERRPLS